MTPSPVTDHAMIYVNGKAIVVGSGSAFRSTADIVHQPPAGRIEFTGPNLTARNASPSRKPQTFPPPAPIVLSSNAPVAFGLAAGSYTARLMTCAASGQVTLGIRSGPVLQFHADSSIGSSATHRFYIPDDDSVLALMCEPNVGAIIVVKAES